MRNGCDYDRVQKVTLYVAIYPFYLKGEAQRGFCWGIHIRLSTSHGIMNSRRTMEGREVSSAPY